MRKEYLSAPLPFQGQKRMFAGKFKEVLKSYPNDAVYVDLFGGSGILSHITKHEKPNATVIYNDYDGFCKRLENIPRSNALLTKLRALTADLPKRKLITDDTRERILSLLEQEEKTGYVDYITLSASLMFSAKFCTDLKGFHKESLYNNIRKTDYPLAQDYLTGLNVVSCDYKELFVRYKDIPNAIFLVDPPYLSTDIKTYRNNYWTLSDYLDVLSVLCNHPFIYFTSNKSSIVELCCWMGSNSAVGNPFKDATTLTFDAHLNHQAGYTDMMLYKTKTRNE